MNRSHTRYRLLLVLLIAAASSVPACGDKNRTSDGTSQKDEDGLDANRTDGGPGVLDDHATLPANSKLLFAIDWRTVPVTQELNITTIVGTAVFVKASYLGAKPWSFKAAAFVRGGGTDQPFVNPDADAQIDVPGSGAETVEWWDTSNVAPGTYDVVGTYNSTAGKEIHVPAAVTIHVTLTDR